jgi:hypothetical protein
LASRRHQLGRVLKLYGETAKMAPLPNLAVVSQW